MQTSTTASTLTVTSSLFADGERMPNETIFNGNGLSGKNESPDLSWSPGPDGTQSYALLCHDPDAPTTVGFTHWIVFNIPKDCTSLPRNAGASETPAGAQSGYNDYSTSTYGGPCPPPGPAHRYQFTVYALDVPKLELDRGSTYPRARFMIRDHILAEGTLEGRFGI